MDGVAAAGQLPEGDVQVAAPLDLAERVHKTGMPGIGRSEVGAVGADGLHVSAVDTTFGVIGVGVVSKDMLPIPVIPDHVRHLSSIAQSIYSEPGGVYTPPSMLQVAVCL